MVVWFLTPCSFVSGDRKTVVLIIIRSYKFGHSVQRNVLMRTMFSVLFRVLYRHSQLVLRVVKAPIEIQVE
jgi:hypothetical protein